MSRLDSGWSRDNYGTTVQYSLEDAYVVGHIRGSDGSSATVTFKIGGGDLRICEDRDEEHLYSMYSTTPIVLPPRYSAELSGDLMEDKNGNVYMIELDKVD